MDTAVVARLRTGDEAAFALLLATYERPLGRYLQALTRERPLTEDLVQETFLRAFLHLNSLQSDEAIRPWLYRIATNLALTALKRRSRFRWLPLLPGLTAPGFEDDLAETDRVQRALARVPLEYRTCLLLTRVEGLKSHEAASVLGLTPEAVRKRISRGQEMLREALREVGGDAV